MLANPVRYKLGYEVDCFNLSNVQFDWIKAKASSREAYAELVGKYTGAEGAGKELGNPAIGVDNYKSVSIPAGLADKLGSIVENMDRSVLIDEDILKFINHEVKLYLDGKKNASQTAKALDEKVTLFLNE